MQVVGFLLLYLLSAVWLSVSASDLSLWIVGTVVIITVPSPFGIFFKQLTFENIEL